MKSTLIYAYGTALFLSSCTPKSDSNSSNTKADSIQNQDSLTGKEMIRQFMSPCNLSQWKKDGIEYDETRNYIKQGFSLTSVTPLVPDANGKYENNANPNVEVKPALGSCHWIFLKRPGTSVSSVLAPEASEVLSQWHSPCKVENWGNEDFYFDELKSMTKKGYSLVSATPIIGDQNGKYAGFPENTTPAPGGCLWTFALNPK